MTFGGLILSVLVAWLVHGGLVLLYRNWFASTDSLLFRIAHASEIFLTTGVAMYIYTSLATNQPSTLAAVGVTLGTLIVLDSVAFALVRTLRQSFDLWHFGAAYLSVAVVAAIVFNL